MKQEELIEKLNEKGFCVFKGYPQDYINKEKLRESIKETQKSIIIQESARLIFDKDKTNYDKGWIDGLRELRRRIGDD